MPPPEEANVITVANAIPPLMGNYDASSSKRIGTLFLYLAQARDVHHWCLTRQLCEGAEWESAETYSTDSPSPVHGAVRAAIDAFVERPLFFDGR